MWREGGREELKVRRQTQTTNIVRATTCLSGLDAYLQTSDLSSQQLSLAQLRKSRLSFGKPSHGHDRTRSREACWLLKALVDPYVDGRHASTTWKVSRIQIKQNNQLFTAPHTVRSRRAIK